MRRVFSAFLLSLFFVLMVGGTAFAKGDDGRPIRPISRAVGPDPSTEPALSVTYAQIVNGAAPVYDNLADAANGAAPIRMLDPGFVWVSLANARPASEGTDQWYALKAGGFVSSQHVSFLTPSAFHGVELDANPDKPMTWLIRDTAASAAPGVPPVKGAVVFKHYTQVTILEEQDAGGWKWYRVGDGQWIPQYRVGVVAPSPRPDGVGPDDRWIEVNLYEQTLAAYQGDQMVFATLVSSGLPRWPTETGLFRVWAKVRQDKMLGDEGQPAYYYLEDIPWIMYFDGATALHAAYWHDDFGVVHSHGCVNLTPQDAQWLYNWTAPNVSESHNWTLSSADNPGTWVWVHN